MARDSPAAPGIPQAALSVLVTIASGKNMLSKIGQRQFQRDFVLSPKSENHHPLPHLKPTAEAVRMIHAYPVDIEET